MKYETCRNCHWWNGWQGNNGTEQTPLFFGECRNHSPQFVPTGMEFPKTVHLDWCGDFLDYHPDDTGYEHSERDLPKA